jgi:hypothetical protein
LVPRIYVSVIPSAKGFAKKLRAELERELKDSGLEDVVAKTFGGRPVKLPVKPEIDPNSVPDKLPPTKRMPKLPVELDPLVEAFQADVRRQVSALSRQVNLEIPASAETGGLRSELAAAISAVQAQLKVQIPTEPAGIREYETKLRAAVAAVEGKVKSHIKVDVDSSDGEVTALPSKLQRITSALQGAAGTAVQFGGSLAGATSAASGPVGTAVGVAVSLGTAIAGIGAAATIGVPALTALAGAAASIPGALAGAAAAFGALSLGFKGISDAFKPASGGSSGGGGEDPASRARRIAGAERAVEAARRGITAANRGLESSQRNLADAESAVTTAVRRSLTAQAAVNRARVEAQEDLDDLGRSLRGARLDEESATLAVVEAERELNAARETGNIPEIQRADLAYRQAQLTLENAKDTTQDLGKEQTQASKLGVEGSEKVQSALRDQVEAQQAVRDAQEGVLDAQNSVLSANDAVTASYDGLKSAQDALAEAQKRTASGGSAAAAAMVKLAPAAQRFVDAIKALKPAFEALRLDVQERLFAGLDKTVTNLGNAWIPALHVTLGRYADTFNSFFRTLGASLAKPTFITDLQAGAEGARRGLEKIAQAVAGPLVEAFGALASASAPFLEDLGGELAHIVTAFSNWVLQGRRSGALASFFDRASVALHDIFAIGGQVGRIVGSIFSILTSSSPGAGDRDPLKQFADGLSAVADYLDDPRHQQQIRDYITGIRDSVASLGRAVEGVSGWIDRLFPPDASGRTESVGQAIGKALVAGLIAGVGAAMKASAELFLSYFLAPGAGSLISALKDRLGIHSPSTVMAQIGRDLIAGLIQGIGASFTALVRQVTLIPGRIRSAIGNAAAILNAHGKNVVIGMANGILSQFNVLYRAAAALPSAVYGALSGAGRWLYGTGQNIVYGLYNGIVSLYSWLRSRVRAFINAAVPQAIQNALGIASPSKVTAQLGRFVAQGLAVGIESGTGMVESAATGMAAAAVPSIAPGVVSGPGRGSSSSSYGAGELRVLVEGTGDWLVDGLRNHIKVRYSGDPVAALSTK